MNDRNSTSARLNFRAGMPLSTFHLCIVLAFLKLSIELVRSAVPWLAISGLIMQDISTLRNLALISCTSGLK
jgi:hypothetical protein